jgi:RNA polymerase sigma-70 factor (ECF subfamily)
MHAAEGENSNRNAYFCTTQWTVILKAGGSDPEARLALERVCETYWYPLYGYCRRKGNSPEDAQDLVQGFFQHLLAARSLAGLDAAKGKFRSFLLRSLNNYLANQWDHANRIKRGGGIQFVSIHAQSAEEQYQVEPVEETTPESLFARSWAETVVKQVGRLLKEEYSRAGELERFEVLKQFLMGGGDSRYDEVAGKLGLSESGVKTCVRRLRLRFRDLLRMELSQTVEDAARVDEEIRELLQALAGSARI